MSRSLLLFLLFFPLLNGEALAENYFISQVESAQPSEQAVEKSRKQLKEYRDLELKKIRHPPPFHFREEATENGKKAFCTNCHLDPPHRKSERKRSFLNQHSRFIACETCHLKEPQKGAFEYRWLAYQLPGEGEWIAADVSVHSRADAVQKSSVPRPGARIAPAFKGVPAVVFKDDDFAHETDKKWQQASVNEKAQMKLKLHAPINKKGKKCQRCHDDEKSMLDFELLGISETVRRAITENLISIFFERYSKENERLRLSNLLN